LELEAGLGFGFIHHHRFGDGNGGLKSALHSGGIGEDEFIDAGFGFVQIYKSLGLPPVGHFQGGHSSNILPDP
jgi:hypothetical protein